MSCDWIALANPGVQKLSPYQPGKPVEELERELGIRNIIKLASNENPLGPSERALSAIKTALGQVNRYPDGSGFSLKTSLCDVLGVSAGQITLGNGSNDVLELAARAWLRPGDEAVFSKHAFAVYPLVTMACSAIPVSVPARDYGHDLEAMAAAINARTRIVFVANPNNPTGSWNTAKELDQFLAAVPEDVLVVLDEAYCEYVEESAYPNGLERLAKYNNLLVTRTFSKIYGLAGLRVGYGVSSEAVAEVMNRVRQPFNCNIVALAAAEAALGDTGHVERSCQSNTAGLAELAEGLADMGFGYIPSVANFIAFDCGMDAMPVFQALLQEGVIVRPLGAYDMPHHLRVTVGTSAENARFLQALQKVTR